MYASEMHKVVWRDFPDGFDEIAAAQAYGEHLLGADAHVLELTDRERTRIFNLGYYTWVEQQGVAVDSFEARRIPGWWQRLHAALPTWDALIDEFNARTGVVKVA